MTNHEATRMRWLDRGINFYEFAVQIAAQHRDGEIDQRRRAYGCIGFQREAVQLGKHAITPRVEHSIQAVLDDFVASARPARASSDLA